MPRPIRLERGEVLPEQDLTRPVEVRDRGALGGSFMRNHCAHCAAYKWVYYADLKDGHGNRYVCARCYRLGVPHP